MNKKIESSLRRGVEQLPQPDYRAIADTTVQKMEVHDYVTRQEAPVRRRHHAPALALVACALLLVAGLFSYLQFFQIYSVVELSINPAFSLSLNRRDQVRRVEALNEDAQDILAGRVYDGWTLEATVGNLLDELRNRGYLADVTDEVTVTVSSKSIERSRVLRESVEGYVDGALTQLPAPAEPEPSPSPALEETPAVTPTPSTSAVIGVPSPPPPSSTAVTVPPTPVTVPPTPATPELLSVEAVKELIRQHLPGAEIEKVELDEDDGQLYYEVQFHDGEEEYEAEIDASTGAILSWEED